MTGRSMPMVTLLTAASAALVSCQFIHWYLTSVASLPVQVFTTPVLEFNLVYSENRGMNFGLFAGDTVAIQATLIAIAVAVCAVLAFVFLRKGKQSYAIAGGMIIGGGLSNIYERLSFGFVFDYINTPVFGLNNPFSYNVADIFIVLPIVWWVFKS